MSLNTQLFGTPDVLFQSKEVAEKFANRTLNSRDLRNEQTRQSVSNGEVDSEFLRGVRGLPVYNAHTGEGTSSISFEKHFNPALRTDSKYFNSLGKLMDCVEKNAEQGNTDACKSEMKSVRMAAF